MIGQEVRGEKIVQHPQLNTSTASLYPWTGMCFTSCDLGTGGDVERVWQEGITPTGLYSRSSAEGMKCLHRGDALRVFGYRSEDICGITVSAIF